MSFCELKTAFLKVHEPGKGSFLRTRARSREPKNGFPLFQCPGLKVSESVKNSFSRRDNREKSAFGFV